MLIGRVAWETADILQQHHCDIWGMTTEIPYWWCSTTQIWLGTRHLYETSAVQCSSSNVSSLANQWWHRDRSTVFSEQEKYDLCHGGSGNDVALNLTIIPRTCSDSIAHEAEGRYSYWLWGHDGKRNNCISKIQLFGQK